MWRQGDAPPIVASDTATAAQLLSVYVFPRLLYQSQTQIAATAIDLVSNQRRVATRTSSLLKSLARPDGMLSISTSFLILM